MAPLHFLSRSDDLSTLTLAENATRRMSQSTFLAITWTTTSISLVSLLFRFYSRYSSFATFHSDDYLALLATLFLLTSSILFQVHIQLLYWMYNVQSGLAPYDADFLAAYGVFLKLIAVWNVLFYSCLWAVKFSLLMFFKRVQGRTTAKGQRVWWWVVVVVAGASFVATVAVTDWGCTIQDVNYVMSRCLYTDKVLFQARTFYANLALDLLTDTLLLTIPIQIVWRVRLPLRKKLVLFGLFSATILVMISSIVRVALVKGTQVQTQQASIDWLYTWCNIEMCIAIVVACVASFRKLFTDRTRTRTRTKTGYEVYGPGGGRAGVGTIGGTGNHLKGRGRYGGQGLGLGRMGAAFKTTITSKDDGLGETMWEDERFERLDSFGTDEQSQVEMVPMERVKVRTVIETRSDLNIVPGGSGGG